jgi:transcriptional regulator with XRE-family HTH domain
MFSQKVKALRLHKRLTLRDFCDQLGIDFSNWSKIERGINPPPKNVEVLEKIAVFFELRGADKLEFMDAAAVERHEIPPDVADNVMLLKALPAFFRSARGHELSEEELKNLFNDIRQLHQPDR